MIKYNILKKIKLLGLILITLASCVKNKYVLVPEKATVIEGKILRLYSDTMLNGGVWDGGGKILTIDQFHQYKIIGPGTFQNWIIDAPWTVDLFDTSINIKNISTSDGVFSTQWYGVKSTNADNWWNIQKSMDVCMTNHLECHTTGKGMFNYSKTLEATMIANGAYQQTYLHFSGDASMWDNGKGTTFNYTGITGPAFNMQLNKGSELNNVVFFGKWKSPGGVDSVYFKNTESTYKDVSGYNLPNWYAGVTIDYHPPLNGISQSGSTGVHIHEVGIGGFSMLLAMSQNGITANDDIMRVENLHLYDGKYGIVNGQAQEKDMQFNGVFSWGSIFQIISIGKHGKWQAGDYKFKSANIAGRCVELFDISIAHWFSTTIEGWFAESIGRIGTFSAQMPLTISNSTFDLNHNFDKQRIVINSNSNWVNFNNCTIRYYDGLINDINVHGYMTFNPLCYFGGGKIVYK